MDSRHPSNLPVHDDLAVLQSRIIALERENASLLRENQHLRKLLTDAGIAITPAPTPMDPNQGARIIFPDAITTQMANRFFQLFWGRQDVFARRSVRKETGAASYFSQCANFWRNGCHRKKYDGVPCKECQMREDKRLTLEDVKQHLLGRSPNATDVIGVYPLLPDDTCHFIVFDFDNHGTRGRFFGTRGRFETAEKPGSKIMIWSDSTRSQLSQVSRK